MAIEPIAKPRGVWCVHASKRTGCGVYASRPSACASFRCLWLDGQTPAHWKPSVSKMVLHQLEQTIVVDVDPGTPNAWRAPQYYNEIKQWSERALTGSAGGSWRVLVSVGDTVWAIFPPEDLLLGEIDANVPVEVGVHDGDGWFQPFARIYRQGVYSEVHGQRWTRQPA